MFLPPRQRDELGEPHSLPEGAAVGCLSHLPGLEGGCRESPQSDIFQNVTEFIRGTDWYFQSLIISARGHASPCTKVF